jgi:hypothetical protein
VRDSAALRQGIFWALVLIYPVVLTFLGFSPKYGFLTLPRFGWHFTDRSLTEIKELNPPRRNEDGYDGQYYIQMAIDPTLKNPEFALAIDNMGYRAQRIGVSALAYALGLGHAPWIAQIYCLLNLVFWLLLCWLTVTEIGCQTREQRLVIIAIVLSAGCLVSLMRALTDLPALALGFLALYCTKLQSPQLKYKVIGLAAAAYSALCKETGMLSFFGLIKWPLKNSWWSNVLTVLVIMSPVLAWKFYVQSNFGSGNGVAINMTWPLFGFVHKWLETFSNAWNQFPSIHVVEFFGPLSIATQVVFLIRYWNLASPLWRFGIGFAVLSLVLGDVVWQTQSAYSRALLPMMLSFNLLLSQLAPAIKRRTWWSWFWLGNIGLLDRAMPILLVWLVLEWLLPAVTHKNDLPAKDFAAR